MRSFLSPPHRGVRYFAGNFLSYVFIAKKLPINNTDTSVHDQKPVIGQTTLIEVGVEENLLIETQRARPNPSDMS